jgi:hypothetical protein
MALWCGHANGDCTQQHALNMVKLVVLVEVNAALDAQDGCLMVGDMVS